MAPLYTPFSLLKRNRKNSKCSALTPEPKKGKHCSQLKGESQEVTNTLLRKRECLKRAIQARGTKRQSNYANYLSLEDNKEKNF